MEIESSNRYATSCSETAPTTPGPPAARPGGQGRALSSPATAPRPAAAADAAPAHPDPVLGQFTDAFLGELDGASKAASPEESALLLKDLVRAGHLRFTRGRGVRTRRRRSKPVSRVGIAVFNFPWHPYARRRRVPRPHVVTPSLVGGAPVAGERLLRVHAGTSVSYTHLTLPTKA